MRQQSEPEEHKSRREVLNAISKVDCLSELLSMSGDHFDYELDLEVTVYGRNYKGKSVGPYVRLFTYDPGTTIINQGDWADNDFYIIVEGEADVFIKRSDGEERMSGLNPGDQFGARSMLAGGARQATVKAHRDRSVQVLKVQRPAVRLLRKLPKFADKLDEVYRDHGRECAVDDLIMKTGVSPALREDIKAISSFKAFSKNHVLFVEASPISRLFLIEQGWVRRSRRTGDEEKIDFLGKGYCLGLEGVIHNEDYRYTATVMGRTEVLQINIVQLRQSKRLKAALLPALEQLAPPDLQERLASHQPLVREKIIAAQDRLISTGVVDGNNLLVMDMDLCVRCGNCSMACHKVHGQSRLTRRGIHITRIEPAKPRHFQSLLVPSVCMHCNNPECLTGCPTGAISRREGGQIDIDRGTCIGCGDCATQCPYDAIFMVHRDQSPALQSKEVKTTIWARLGLSPEPEPQPVTGTEDLLAIKCNLCSDRAGLNPPGSKSQAYSCEENCPTGALARIVPSEYFAEIGQIENLRMLDRTHAYGRNIHRSDPTRRWIHGIGISLFILSAALTVAALQRYGYGQRLPGLPNMRWITGLAGFAGILGAAAYQLRRKVYDKRRWPLRYWMLVHTYLGVMACFVVMLHGGTFSGGWLTRVLMISFDVAIFTGLFGLACYQIAPRLLTRIEGTPLLIDDLKARREELRREQFEIISGPHEDVSSLVKERVLPRFDSMTATLRQFVKQDGIETLVDAARQEFRATAEKLTQTEERHAFDRSLRAAALLPRVNALIFLHNLLKVWLAPHIGSVYLMLALMLVHVVQVVYASW